MIKFVGQNINTLNKSTRSLQNRLDKEANGKYLTKFLCFDLSDGEIDENSIIFKFDGLKESVAQFSLNIRPNSEIDVKILLNNVKIFDKKIYEEKVLFSSLIDYKNTLKIIVSDISVVSDLMIEVLGNVVSQKRPIRYNVLSHSQGFAVTKHTNYFNIYHADSIEKVKEKLSNNECTKYAKNYLLDYAYLCDLDGVKNQEVLLVEDGQVVLKNLSTNTSTIIAGDAEIGSLIESKNMLCKIALVIDGKLRFFQVSSGMNVSELQNSIKITGKITSISGFQGFSSNREGMLITTDDNISHIVFFNSDNIPYMYDEIKNAWDSRGTFFGDRLYVFTKNSDKIMTLYIYQFSDKEFERKKVIFQKQYFNCDCMFLVGGKIHFISDDICTEEALEESIY